MQSTSHVVLPSPSHRRPTLQMSPPEGFLRQRKAPPPDATESSIVAESSVVGNEEVERKDEIVWGKTPGGEGMSSQSSMRWHV